VRLRLTRPGDELAIAALLARFGIQLEPLEAARLVRLDPRRRLVICATALVDMHEVIVGIGAIELEPLGRTEPDTLFVDDELTDGLRELLTSALVGRAGAIARSRAA
jgi:hypothetical protein